MESDEELKNNLKLKKLVGSAVSIVSNKLNFV